MGETGRKLGNRIHEHLRDIERNDKDESKPVVCHFNLANHPSQNMAACGLSGGNTESRKKSVAKTYLSNRHSYSPRNLSLFSPLP